MPVDDDELDAVALESNHTIEIDSFVPREQIDERHLESPYYVLPSDQVGQEAFPSPKLWCKIELYRALGTLPSK